MARMTLDKTRLIAGIWQGILQAGSPGAHPEIEVVHLEKAVPGVALHPVADQPGQWRVVVPVPLEALCDGVQTFLIRDKSTGDTLNSFTIVTGAALEDDIRAEVDLLRAELDMLKKAFRRHCLETAG